MATAVPACCFSVETESLASISKSRGPGARLFVLSAHGLFLSGGRLPPAAANPDAVVSSSFKGGGRNGRESTTTETGLFFTVEHQCLRDARLGELAASELGGADCWKRSRGGF